MPRLELALLGSPRITLDGKPLGGAARDRTQLLLAYLAVEQNRPHWRDALADLFWTERDAESCRTNLRQLLFRLRRLLGADESGAPFLQIDREQIRFDSTADYALDVDELSSAVVCAGSDSACEACLSKMERAAECYRGEFLAGVVLGLDAEGMEGWLVQHREKLHRNALGIVERLAHCYERRAQWSQVLRWAERYVELDPLNEAGHRALMRTLARRGQVNAGLAQYRGFEALLAEELGIQPQEETRALRDAIQRGDIHRIDDYIGASGTHSPWEASTRPNGASAGHDGAGQEGGPTVLIVDDHALVRDGLRLLLDGLGEPIEYFEAGSCEEGIERLSIIDRLDLVLLDLALPGVAGRDAIRLFQEHAPEVPIIVISASEKVADARNVLDAGARGFISKSSSGEVILGAVRLVLAGGTYTPPLLTPDNADDDAAQALPDSAVQLTPRQRDVLVLLALGKPNKFIGRALGMAESTVRVHATAIYKVLGVTNRTEAAYAAARLGLLPESFDEFEWQEDKDPPQ